MSLQQSLEASRAWDINSAPAQKITKLICEMIVLDNQPFVMVEDIGFVRLMNHVAPRYHIPDRRHFSGSVIPDLVTKAQRLLCQSYSKKLTMCLSHQIFGLVHTIMTLS